MAALRNIVLIPKIAIFERRDRSIVILGRHLASKTSFCLDPDGYAYSRPEQSWDYEPTWLEHVGPTTGSFVRLVDVRDEALTWARQRRLIMDGPGFEVTWPEGNGWRRLTTFDEEEAEHATNTHPGARRERLPMARPSDRFAARLEHDFGMPIYDLETVEAAAVGLWLAAHHPTIDGILAPPGELGEQNAYNCGSLVMNTRDRWIECEPPDGGVGDTLALRTTFNQQF